MRTTIDIPDQLLRLAKAEAALRGTSLKQLVAEALEAELGLRAPAGLAERAKEAGGEPEQDLGPGRRFPLIRGEGGPVLRGLGPRSLQELLDAEDADRDVRPR
jgi:hypothetical protein